MEAGALRKLIYDATKETSNGPVDIVNANNEFKSTYDILLDISRVWEDLDDMTKATLLEKIAGKHRASVVSALLNDTKTLEDAYADALQSAGSASEEFEKRTKSIEYHLQQLYAAWQELATNTATVEWINGIIDGLRSIVELVNKIGLLNLGSALTGAVGGFGLFHKLIPAIEGIGLDATEKKEKFKVLGDGFKKIAEVANSSGMEKASKNIYKLIDGFDLFEGKSPLVAGGIKVIANALLTFTKTIPVMLIAGGGVALITELLGKYEEWKNRAVTAADETNTLANELKNLQAEYELLSGKETLTDVEKERLEVLKDEIALQEADLELSKQRLAELNSEKYSHIKTDHNGNKYLDDSSTADEMLADEIDDTTYQYGNATSKIKALREELKIYDKQVHDTTISEEERQVALQNLKRIKDELTTSQNQLTSAESQLQENYDKLLTQESELTNIIENKVGLSDDERDAYKEKLALTQNNIDLYKILLGLEEADAEYLQTQLNGLGKTEAVNRVLKEMQSEVGLSEEALEDLKKVYPEINEKIELFGIVAGKTYDESSVAVTMLENAHRTAFNAMNDDQLTATIVARDNAITRLEQYKNEAEALKSLYESQSQAQQNATNQLMDGKLSLSDIGASVQAVGGNILSSVSALLYENKNAEINKLNEQIASYDAIIDSFDSAAQRAKELMGNTENGDPPGDGKGPGSGDGDKTDLWDKYANAIEKITQKLEQYDKAIESTESALDLNQSYEERSLELMSEEYDLYGDLIEQYTNKSVAQQEALAATNELIAEMYARLKELTGVDMSNMTQAEMDEWLNTNLSKKELDSTRGQEIKQIIDALATALDTQHDWNMQVDETKSKLNELNRSQVNIRINFQNDATEKFEESRESAEKVLDILEEIEGTEQRRIDLLDALNDSYETEFAQNLKMYDETIKDLQGMEKGSDAYNDTLKEAHRLEMRNLEIIQEQLDAQLRQIDAERQLALQRNESLVYGEQGKDAWEKSREREIDRLQNQLDALEEDTSEADYLEQLTEKEEHIAELEEKLANLRNQKTIQQLKQQEDGSFQWEYVEDQRAINETLEELEDAKNDLQKTKDDKALQDKKDAIQDEIDAMEDEISERAERLEIMNEQDEEYFKERERLAQENAEAMIAIIEEATIKTNQALEDLKKKTKSELKETDDEAQKGLEKLANTYSFWLEEMSGDIQYWVDRMVDEFDRIAQARIEAEAEIAAGLDDEESAGSYAGGIKFVKANNMPARLHYGERVLTRQEAEQYNELEDDIKSGKLQDYFASLREDTALSISNVAATSVTKALTVPSVASNMTSFVIEHLELPNVQDPTDFAAVINEWARGEFGGLAQKARIVPAR